MAREVVAIGQARDRVAVGRVERGAKGIGVLHGVHHGGDRINETGYGRSAGGESLRKDGISQNPTGIPKGNPTSGKEL